MSFEDRPEGTLDAFVQRYGVQLCLNATRLSRNSTLGFEEAIAHIVAAARKNKVWRESNLETSK